MKEGTKSNGEINDRHRRYPTADSTQEKIEKQAGNVRKQNSYDIRISSLGSIAIMVADICLLTVFTYFGNVFLAIASISVVTFMGILTLADYVSIEPSISTGEMRGAMAGSIMVVYLIVVAFAFSNEDSASTAFASTVVQHLTYVVGIVVVFYFGSKAVLQYIEGKKDKPTTENG